MHEKMPSRVASSLVVLAEGTKDEICGFVFRDWSFTAVPNLAEVPQASFFMDPQVQVEVLRKSRSEIVGIYHSHPGGTPNPSPSDIDGWPSWELGWRYWIISHRFVREWEQTDDGPLCIWSWPDGLSGARLENDLVDSIYWGSGPSR